MLRSSVVRSGLALLAVATVGLTGSVTAQAAAAKPALTSKQAQKLLLRTSDFPRTWRASPPEDVDSSSVRYSPARCRSVDGTTKGNLVLAEAAFEDPSDTGPVVDETIYRPRKGSAKAEVKNLNSLLQGCATYTVKDPETTYTMTVTPRKYAKVADGAIAFRGTTTIEGTKITFQAVVVVVNREVVRFDSSGPGNGFSTRKLDALVRKGVARIQAR